MHACRTILRAACLVALAVALGCAHGGARSGESGLASLRQRAADAPGDPVVQRNLLLAEIFAHDGDPERAGEQVQRALEVAARDPRAWLAAGLHHDVHGRAEPAADAYLKVLALAPASGDPLAPHLMELAVSALGGTDGAFPGYVQRVRPALERFFDASGVSMPARHDAGELLIDLAYRRGDRPAAQAIAARMGCVTSMRVAGPFGPRDLLGFDGDYGVDVAKPLAARYDLGPGRGVRETRPLGAKGCTVNLGGSPVGRGGTSFVQGALHVPVAGRYMMRFESPNSVEIHVDGELVHRADRRTRLTAGVRFVPLELSAGRHLLTVKLGTRHPNPVVSLAVRPLDAVDLAAGGMPYRAGARDGFPRYLRSSIAMLRGDVLTAREALAGVASAGSVSPMLAMQRASLFLADPLFPDDMRADEARRMLAFAFERDPMLWNPAVQLANFAAQNGRTREAISALREALERWPEVPAVGLTLVELLRNEQWNAEADDVLDEVRELVPDACGPMNAELQALRARGREAQAAELSEKIMACDARANARYATLLRQRRWDDAKRELARLEALEPPQNSYAWLLAGLELAKNRGDEDAIERYIAELRERYPRSTTGLMEQLDRLLAAGEREQALSALREGLSKEHEALSELHRLAPVMGAEHVMAPYRRDGAEAIERFEQSGRSYSSPQVLVFDYMAVRLFEDGSSIELVHTVQKAQSDEAIDELAEVHVPEGARVLTLQNIKPDGRRLEPDAIAGKDAISLPSMASGDYVELEYLLHEPSSEAFPRGYLGDRFYFKSFETPFDYSHMVVVLPEDMPYSVDPRGAAPEVQERIEDGLRVLSFKVEQSAPAVPEPGSVSAKEYLPSIRVGVRAGWPAMVESIRDALVDRDLYDPQMAALAEQVVGDAAPGDHRLRAERLYGWVLENVENNNDMFSQASSMVRARAGNRARVLKYLLSLAGVPAELSLVRSATNDATESQMADGETFEHLLVRLGEGQQSQWLFTAERWAPFGFIPPLLRDQPALSLGAEHPAERMHLPPTREGEDRREMVLDVKLRADGSARVDVVETVHGAGAVSWRSQLESVPAAELEHRFAEEYVARLMPGATLAALEIDGREQQAESIRLDYSFDVPVLGRKVSGGWALPSMLAQKLAANYAAVPSRTTEQLVGNPLDMRVVLRFSFPPGARKPEVPEDVRLEAAVPGRPSYTMTAGYDDGTLVIERQVRVPLMRVSPRAYPAFAAFCRMVDTAEARELVVGLPQESRGGVRR